MERKLPIEGTLKGFDDIKKAVFYYAYDQEENILHLRDKDNHHGVSLINSISSQLRDRIIKHIESIESIQINRNTLRCFIYDDDDSGLMGNEVDEYVFALEGTDQNPFRSIKRKESNLRYWY